MTARLHYVPLVRRVHTKRSTAALRASRVSRASTPHRQRKKWKRLAAAAPHTLILPKEAAAKLPAAALPATQVTMGKGAWLVRLGSTRR